MTANLNSNVVEPHIEIDAFVSILIETWSPKVKHINQIDATLLRVELKLAGEHDFDSSSASSSSSQLQQDQQIDLNRLNLINIREVYAANTNGNGYFFDFRTKIFDVGKIKELILSRCELFNDESDFLNEIRVKIPYRNDFQIFPVEQFVKKSQRNLVLRSNLKPGEKGHRQLSAQRAGKQPEIGIQLIGEKGKTKLIPLLHSQLNKQHAFLAGRKDVFDVLATDVGRVLLRTIDFDRTERSNSTSNTSIINNNKLSGTTIAPNPGSSVGSSGGAGGGGGSTGGGGGGSGGLGGGAISSGVSGVGAILSAAQSALASSVSSSSSASSHHHHHSQYHHHHHHHQQQRHLIDVYFVMTGENGSTKKIYLNNYEIKRHNDPAHDDPKEKYFEFKSDDVGKLLKVNVSINQDDDPATYLYIDFIEIKIPSKSAAFKFPVERVLGEFYEDGKCDLDLIVWKHPERPNHIDYEILTEINDDSDKETMGRLYLIMHGDQGRTGKIVLNDGNYDNNSIDNYEFAAPDVGKLNKIELFFYPTEQDATWQLESIEVKLKARNEAYKFPVQCTLDIRTNYLELIPWKKPNIIRNKAISSS